MSKKLNIGKVKAIPQTNRKLEIRRKKPKNSYIGTRPKTRANNRRVLMDIGVTTKYLTRNPKMKSALKEKTKWI